MVFIYLSLSGKDFLIEALKYHLLKGEQKATFKSPRIKPRQPVGLPKVSFLLKIFQNIYKIF